MADEIFKRDSNRVTVGGGVTDDGDTDVTQFRIDPTTKRLLVSGVALDKATDDILVYANTAKDGSGTSYVPLLDSDGHLQVDLLSGGGGTQYDVDDALGATPTGMLAVGIRDDALSALTPVEGDAIGLRVDANGALWVIPSGTVTVDGSAVTQPISGTITANLSAVDNAVLDTIDAVLDTINTKLVTGTVIGDVNLGATDNAVLDDIAAKLATIDTDTSALAAAVSTEYQVDIVGSLPAGTNAIGKLAANSGVDIGDVDVLSLPALPAGTNAIGKVGHDITGVGHGVKVVTTAGTDVVLAASTACKKVEIQAQTDNTGLIAVGGSGVDATEATGTGIILYAGDIYSLEIDNLADIFIDSTVNGEGVRYSYFT